LEIEVQKAKEELKKVQTEKAQQKYIYDNEMQKLKDENKTLQEKITAFEEERKKMQEQVDQAFIQGKR
jgi:predicted  nucleic acid-binding Zn-ribbon protein